MLPAQERNALPVRQKRTRKNNAPITTPTKVRSRNPSQSRAAKIKAAKDAGQAHVSLSGKTVEARKMRLGCTAKCPRSCHANITDEKRQEIFVRYWDLKSLTRQWDFIARLVKIGEVKRSTKDINDMVDEPFRKHTYDYFLYDPSTSIPIKVCQLMFVDTLDIGVRTVRTVITRLITNGGKISPDKRGKNPKPSRLNPLLISGVINHIKRYPTVDSHYCRSSTKRKYLDEKLTVAKMHRMYIAERHQLPHTATLRQFRDIFNTKFNLAFFQPKKDQCSKCLQWKHATEAEKSNEDFANTYYKHLADKELIRQIRRENKETSKVNSETERVCTFDLQKVLYCPKGENGEFFL